MMGGGGGTPGGSSAGLFLPPGQGEVANQLRTLVQPMAEQGTNALNALGGVSPAQSAYPFVQGTTYNVLNNPYQGDAVGGGYYARDIFQNNILPAGFGGADQFGALASIASGQLPGPISAMNNPAYAGAGQVGTNLSEAFQPAVRQALGDVYSPQFTQAISAGQRLSPGFESATAKFLGDMFGPSYQRAGQVGHELSNDFSNRSHQALADVYSPQYLAAIGEGLRAGPQLTGAASSILGTAFDPQNALHDRTYQQLMDQQNAISSQAGIAGTPYGAGVAGQTASNFDIDWQNNRLNRMTQGGQAASALDLAGISAITNPSLAATQGAATAIGAGAQAGNSAISSLINPAAAATNAAATDIGAASNAGQSAINSILTPSLAANQAAGNAINSASTAMNSALGGLLTPANAQVVAQLQGSGALGNLGGLVNTGATGRLGMFNNLASAAPGYMAAPYNAYNTTQGNNFGALQNEINLGNANYLLPQQTIGNLEQYLGLGQSASSIATQVGNNNFNQGMQTAQGVGSLLGQGGNLLTGGQGIGGLFGGGGGIPAVAGQAFDAAGSVVPFGSEAAVAAGGGGDFLASAAPLAFSAP